MSELLATYQTAIIMTGLLVIAVNAQSFIAAMYKIVMGKQPPGIAAAGDNVNADTWGLDSAFATLQAAAVTVDSISVTNQVGSGSNYIRTGGIWSPP